MSVSCFTSTNSHLCKFLRTTGRDWHNTIYIECGDCQRAVSRSCRNLLCAFDSTGAPVIVPVHDVEYLFGTTVDKSECRAILTKANFCELYKALLLSYPSKVQLKSSPVSSSTVLLLGHQTRTERLSVPEELHELHCQSCEYTTVQ